MEAVGETCKLCLKYIQGASLASLDENLIAKLRFLQMNLENSVEENNSVCKECEEKIQDAFNFKSCVVNINGEDIKMKNNINFPITTIGESSLEKLSCYLCKKMVCALTVISFSKLLKDDSMMEVFQGHIPEIGLKTLQDSVVCFYCQKSLVSFSTLIASWSIANDWNDEEMKEELGNYEMVEVKKEDPLELSDSTTNSSCAIDFSGSVKQEIVKLKTEINEISDSAENVSVNTNDIKKDVQVNEDEQLKNEEVDIKHDDEEE